MAGEEVAVAALRTGQAVAGDTARRAAGSVADSLRRAGMRGGSGSPVAVDGRLWGGARAMADLLDE